MAHTIPYSIRLVLLVLATVLLAAFKAAAFTYSGQVLNPTGKPLPGAVITVKGTSLLATTNSTGVFLLAVEQTSPVLQVSCQGYQAKTLAAHPQQALAVTLYPIGVAPPLGTDDAPTVNTELIIPDVQPAYPGGAAAYQAYIQQNVRYPEAAKSAGKSGAVFVSFIVDEVGRVLDAQVAKGCGYGLDEEALRLVRLMPWWKPGQLAGQPVRVPCTLRIRFDTQQL